MRRKCDNGVQRKQDRNFVYLVQGQRATPVYRVRGAVYGGKKRKLEKKMKNVKKESWKNSKKKCVSSKNEKK